MFRGHHTIRVRFDKELEAYQWAKELAEYLSAKYSPISVRAYAEILGDICTVHWYADFEDLATMEPMESLSSQVDADDNYVALINKSADLFIEGSEHITLTQSI